MSTKVWFSMAGLFLLLSIASYSRRGAARPFAAPGEGAGPAEKSSKPVALTTTAAVATENQKNTVLTGSQIGVDGTPHTLWTVNLTGKDSSAVTVRLPQPNIGQQTRLYEIDQLPGITEAPDVAVTMGGVPL